VGRVWREDMRGPAVVAIRGGLLIDITSKDAPTMRDLLEGDDPVGLVRTAAGAELGPVDRLLHASRPDLRLLAPIDLQAIKACGVTFARSMIERVIEERAAGNPELAAKVRERVGAIIGDSLRDLKAGSPEAEKVKGALIDEGLWSQ